MLKWRRKSPGGLSLTNDCKATKESWKQERCLSREEHTSWLSNAEWSALKTYMQVTLDRLSVFRNIKAIFGDISVYPHTDVHVLATDESKGHEFEV